MPEALRRISLEIWDTEGQLRGRLAEPGGPSLDFEGWLGLLSVLGCLLDDAPPRGASTPHLDAPIDE